MAREKLGDLTNPQRSKLLTLLGKSPDFRVEKFGKHIHLVYRTGYFPSESRDAPAQVATISRGELTLERNGYSFFEQFHESVKSAYQKVTEAKTTPPSFL